MELELDAVKHNANLQREFTPFVLEIVDKRHKDELGNGLGHFIVQSPLEWIERSLQQRGYVFSKAGSDKPYCKLNLDLNVLDVQSSNGTKTASLVFTAKNTQGDTGHIVRGSSVGILWLNSNPNEVESALGRALEDALDKLEDRLQHLCNHA